MKEEKIEHDFIGKIEKDEVQEIEAICDKYEIKNKIDKRLKIIKIAGLSNQNMACYKELLRYLNDRHKKAMDDAIEISRLIQWEYSTDKKTWLSYDILTNQKIELARRNGNKNF